MSIELKHFLYNSRFGCAVKTAWRKERIPHHRSHRGHSAINSALATYTRYQARNDSSVVVLSSDMYLEMTSTCLCRERDWRLRCKSCRAPASSPLRSLISWYATHTCGPGDEANQGARSPRQQSSIEHTHELYPNDYANPVKPKASLTAGETQSI